MPKTYKLTTNWQLILRKLNIPAGNVLRHAGLSEDLLAREHAAVTEEEFFRFWRGVEAEAGDRPVLLEITNEFSLEAFDPAIFAALCSPDMNCAAQRLSRFKALIGPLKLDVAIEEARTQLVCSGVGAKPLPPMLGIAELLFFVQFARRATRAEIVPEQITVIEQPAFQADYEDFFGVRIKKGRSYSIAFTASDAARPFLTANVAMWKFFEPVLSQRLAEIHKEATVSERVHAALYEMLPAGRTSIEEVSSTLGMSTRSLQRRLNSEKTSFKDVLNNTREKLARHYLGQSSMTATEIAFLLGFDEPNSFFRAFKTWTGQTPQSIRATLN